MAKKYGRDLTNVLNGTEQSRGPGTSMNAAMRVYREVFSLADLLTADTIVLSKPRNGDVILGFKITGSVDISAMNIAIGDAVTPNYYMTAVAGPAVPGVPKEVGLAAAIDDVPLANSKEIIGTLTGTVPGAGILVVQTIVSHR